MRHRVAGAVVVVTLLACALVAQSVALAAPHIVLRHAHAWQVVQRDARGRADIVVSGRCIGLRRRRPCLLGRPAHHGAVRPPRAVHGAPGGRARRPGHPDGVGALRRPGVGCCLRGRRRRRHLRHRRAEQRQRPESTPCTPTPARRCTPRCSATTTAGRSCTTPWTPRRARSTPSAGTTSPAAPSGRRWPPSSSPPRACRWRSSPAPARARPSRFWQPDRAGPEAGRHPVHVDGAAHRRRRRQGPRRALVAGRAGRSLPHAGARVRGGSLQVREPCGATSARPWSSRRSATTASDYTDAGIDVVRLGAGAGVGPAAHPAGAGALRHRPARRRARQGAGRRGRRRPPLGGGHPALRAAPRRRAHAAPGWPRCARATRWS